MTKSIRFDQEYLGATDQDIARRIHDLREAIQTMQYVMTDLKSGYRFDDEQAAAKLKTLEACTKTLCSESGMLLKMYQQLR